MFASIVVGTDGSDSASRAVLDAADLAKAHQSRLHIVIVDPKKAKADNDGTSAAALQHAAELAAGRGVQAATHNLNGDPADAIVAVADDLGADLVVVGSKGLGGVKGFLLGSVPAKVTTNAPCSVLVVRTA